MSYSVAAESAERGDLPISDGSICRIRSIGQDDRALLVGCFEGLSPESRRLRFFGAKPSLSTGDLDFLAGADGRDHIAVGLIRLDADGEEVELLGAARCIRLGRDSDTAELAMAVVDRAQGQGIGRILISHLVEAARAQGVRRLRCEVLAANEGMRALLGGPGSRVRWLDDGTLEYEYALPGDAADPADAPLLLGDPVLGLADAWSSELDRVMGGLFLAWQFLIGTWLVRWPFAWPEEVEPKRGLGSGAV